MLHVIIIVWLNRSRIFEIGTGVPESHAFGTGVPESHAFWVRVPRILGQSPTHFGSESHAFWDWSPRIYDIPTKPKSLIRQAHQDFTN